MNNYDKRQEKINWFNGLPYDEQCDLWNATLWEPFVLSFDGKEDFAQTVNYLLDYYDVPEGANVDYDAADYVYDHIVTIWQSPGTNNWHVVTFEKYADTGDSFDIFIDTLLKNDDDNIQ